MPPTVAPLSIHFPDKALADLRRRIEHTRLPDAMNEGRRPLYETPPPRLGAAGPRIEVEPHGTGAEARRSKHTITLRENDNR